MVEEIGDALPVHVLGNDTGTSNWWVWFRIRQLERGVGRVASTGNGPASQHAEDAQVVLDSRYARGGAVLNHRLHRFNLAIALGTLAEHDARIPFPIDVR